MKILMDLSQTAENSTGIQVDMKLTLQALIAKQENEISAMWYDQIGNTKVLGIKRTKTKDKKMKFENYSDNFSKFISTSWGKTAKFETTKIYKIYDYLRHLYKIYLKRNFQLIPVGEMYSYAMFRKYLPELLQDLNLDAIRKINLFFANTSKIVYSHRILLNPKLPIPKIDTSNYDAVICQTEIPFYFSERTLKIIRIHDLIPILQPDCVSGAIIAAKLQYWGIKRIIHQRSYFVANSNQTKNQLLKFFPELSERVSVIPCPVNESFTPSINTKLVKMIIKNKITEKFGGNNCPDLLLNKILVSDFDYILISGTIEPRKNHITLIKAFSHILSTTEFSKPLKLVIVGKFGWKYDEIMQILDPFVRRGEIFVLENVTNSELKNLYSGAKCFVFPSYSEGFGIPPLEAMRCGIPVISSNIPVHLEVQKDAAFYFDPYDVKGLINQILFVLDVKNIALIKEKIEKGFLVVENYNIENTLRRWNELFIDLKTRKIL